MIATRENVIELLAQRNLFVYGNEIKRIDSEIELFREMQKEFDPSERYLDDLLIENLIIEKYYWLDRAIQTYNEEVMFDSMTCWQKICYIFKMLFNMKGKRNGRPVDYNRPHH